MSKESRRAARLARESRRAGGAGRPTDGGVQGSATSASIGSPTGSVRRTGSTPPARAGRRERSRPLPQASFFERYRTAIITVAAVAILGIVGAFVFLGNTAPVFACSTQFNPSPTPTVSPDSSQRLGFVEEYMGNQHQGAPPFTYTYCPPASGNHYNAANLGPIVPRVYKPGDKIGPPNWIHNLEHGALVVLYRGDSPGATADGQAGFKSFYDTFPPSPICKVPRGQISPVIAEFDQMPHAYAALVWGRVLYLDSWDPDTVLRFYATESERLDANGAMVAPPEKVYCSPSAPPSAGAPVGSGAPSDAGGASVAPSAATSPAGSPAASPAPS